MDVERQFERFVAGIGNTDAPREEHRRQLRKQVLAMVESAGTSAPMIPRLNTRRFIISNASFRWSAATAALSGRRRFHKLLVASVAGLAACLAVGITAWVLTHGGTPADTALTASTGGAPRETRPNGTAKVETSNLLAATPGRSQIDTTPHSGTSQASVNLMPVQEASAIVRVKMLAFKDGVLDFEVTRVIYGRVDGKVVHVRYEGSNFEVGREGVLFLRDRPQGENPAVWPFLSMTYDAPQYPLDKFEKDVVEAIKTRAHETRIAATPNPGSSESLSVRKIPHSRWLAAKEVSAIVRVKMLALEDDQLVCEVIRVIYGPVNGKVVHVRRQEESVRNSFRKLVQESKSAEEIRAKAIEMHYFAVGREVMLYMKGEPQGTNPAVWSSSSMSADAPPWRLDQVEKELVEDIKTGAYLRPDVELNGLLTCIGPSGRVVRARLVKIGETSAQWQVTGLLYGASLPGQGPGSAPLGDHPAAALQPEKPATISVELATWRVRAEVIVRHRVAQQPGAAVKEEEIQAEYAHLLKDELTPEREAILFITPREKPADGTVYKVTGVLYGDADKANSLDQLDKAIRKALTEIPKGNDNIGSETDPMLSLESLDG